jgi:hypothetical protein
LVSGYEATAALELAIQITEMIDADLKERRGGGDGGER